MYKINLLIAALLLENVFTNIYVRKISNKVRPKLLDQFFCVTIQSDFLNIGTMVVDALLAILMYIWVSHWQQLCLKYVMAYVPVHYYGRI